MTISAVKQRLRSIKILIHRASASHYEIARELVLLKESSEHIDAGYNSFDQMAISELPLHLNTVHNYIAFNVLMNRHKYTKTQATKLLDQFSLNEIVTALRAANGKLTAQQIAAHNNQGTHEKINISLSRADVARMEKVLGRLGLTHSESGRRQSLTDSFLALIEQHEKSTTRTRRRAA